MMRQIERTYSGFWAEHLFIKWRQAIWGEDDLEKILSVYRKEAHFLREVLALSPGRTVLDLGCGTGDHCIALAQQGIKATGIDIIPIFVDYASHQATKVAVSAKFLCADMRTFRPKMRFDAVYTSSGTFGLFDDVGNRDVLQTVLHVLKNGGKFLIGPSSPDLLEMKSFCRKEWCLVEDGCLLRELIWDRQTSTFHEIPYLIDMKNGAIVELVGGFDGKGVEKGWKSPVYSLAQLEEMVKEKGLVIEATYGSFDLPPRPYGSGSNQLLIVGVRGS